MRIDRIQNVTSKFLKKEMKSSNVMTQMLKKQEAPASVPCMSWLTSTMAYFGIGKVLRPLEKMLKNKGVIMQDGLAVIKGTGEKFTGKVRRNIKPFGWKRETFKFKDGIKSEKVITNFLGKETNTEFYRNGKLYYTVDVGKREGLFRTYKIMKYDEDGPRPIEDARRFHQESVFMMVRHGLEYGDI